MYLVQFLLDESSTIDTARNTTRKVQDVQTGTRSGSALRHGAPQLLGVSAASLYPTIFHPSDPLALISVKIAFKLALTLDRTAYQEILTMTKEDSQKDGENSGLESSSSNGHSIHAKQNFTAQTPKFHSDKFADMHKLSDMEQEEKRIQYDLTVSSPCELAEFCANICRNST